MFDLIIKNGFLIDPFLNIEEEYDIAFQGEKVAKIEKDISVKEGVDIYDASGKIVTPGLIDLHTHLYWGVSHYGINADSSCLLKGVTTAIDAGTSGAENFEGFKKYVIEESETRIIAFLHISSMGLTLPQRIGELIDFRNLDFQKAVDIGRKYSDIICGIKIRLNSNIVGEFGPQALVLAKEASNKLDKPLMVHPGSLPSNLPLSDVLSILGKGDIITHCFPPAYPPDLPTSTVLNSKKYVIPEVFDAIKRGVYFDVGHGRGSFSFETAEKAFEQGYLPTSISTDLHSYSIIHPVYDMATTISKFLNMGLPLRKIIELTTISPASVLGLDSQIGTLKEGYSGDATILYLEKGTFNFWDSINSKRVGSELLKVKDIVKGGKLVSDTS
ncbi:MAG: amidohydrolase/deacetylase family metallohydrolase [Promethearchaeota archaeon]|jgi:dihydroorotase